MFQTFIFTPMYNLLVFLVNTIPGSEIWVAVSILTLIIKICLIPLYKKQVKDQVTIAHITPKIKALQEKYKDSKKPEDKQKMGQEMMGLYKEYKVNPLMTILILIIQFPILFALYKIFLDGVNKHSDLLYSFIQKPDNINTFFFGISLESRSIVLALVAGITMFILNVAMFKKTDPAVEESEFQKSLMLQMKYVLPIVIGAVSYFTPAVVAIYIIVGNLFGIAQEYYIKRPLERKIKLDLASKN
jgi:YidC/Oxa1 family membrane protein insertase